MNLHKEGACLIHHLIRNIITHSLKVMLDRNLALGSQLLDFLRTLVFPILDISVCANTEGATLITNLVMLLGDFSCLSYSKNNCPDIVIKAGCSYGLLMCLRRTSLVCENETSANPDS